MLKKLQSNLFTPLQTLQNFLFLCGQDKYVKNNMEESVNNLKIDSETDIGYFTLHILYTYMIYR